MELTEMQTAAVIIQRLTFGKSSHIIVMMQLVNPAALPVARVINIKKNRTANNYNYTFLKFLAPVKINFEIILKT